MPEGVNYIISPEVPITVGALAWEQDLDAGVTKTVEETPPPPKIFSHDFNSGDDVTRRVDLDEQLNYTNLNTGNAVDQLGQTYSLATNTPRFDYALPTSAGYYNRGACKGWRVTPGGMYSGPTENLGFGVPDATTPCWGKILFTLNDAHALNRPLVRLLNQVGDHGTNTITVEVNNNNVVCTMLIGGEYVSKNAINVNPSPELTPHQGQTIDFRWHYDGAGSLYVYQDGVTSTLGTVDNSIGFTNPLILAQLGSDLWGTQTTDTTIHDLMIGTDPMTKEELFAMAPLPRTRKYISPTGTGDGLTPDTPWSWKDAANNAVAGDTIFMRAGNYSGTDGEVSLPVSVSGAPDNPIIWQPYVDEVPEVIIAQSQAGSGRFGFRIGTPTAATGWVPPLIEHHVFRGISFSSETNADLSSNAPMVGAFVLNNATNITIEDCAMKWGFKAVNISPFEDATYSETVEDITVRRNTIDEVGVWGANSGYAIGQDDWDESATHASYRVNVISNTLTGGGHALIEFTHINGGEHKIVDNYIQQKRGVISAQDAIDEPCAIEGEQKGYRGIIVFAGDVLVDGNFVDGTGSNPTISYAGIKISGPRAIVRNNVVNHAQAKGSSASRDDLNGYQFDGATGLRYYHNTVVNSDGEGVEYQGNQTMPDTKFFNSILFKSRQNPRICDFKHLYDSEIHFRYSTPNQFDGSLWNGLCVAAAADPSSKPAQITYAGQPSTPLVMSVADAMSTYPSVFKNLQDANPGLAGGDIGEAATYPGDFSVSGSATCEGTAQPLTTVTAVADDITVGDGSFFVPLDRIKIGATVCTVTAVSGNVLTVSPAITPQSGDGVYYSDNIGALQVLT